MYETMLSCLRHVRYMEKIRIPGTSYTIQPVNYYCCSYSIVYLLICDKSHSEIYVGETLNDQQLRLYNHKNSIRNNSRGFPVAVHINSPDYSHKNRDVLLSEAISKRRQTDSFVNKR